MEVLAELVARISADATELKKGLTDAEKDTASSAGKIEKQTASIGEQFKQVGRLATGMGAAIVAAMTMAIMSFTKVGSGLNDLSLKTGVSVKTLAGLQYAAEQNGASMGTIEMAIRRVSTAMEDAKDGTSAASKSFDKLGLSLTDFKGLNPEEQFLKIAEAIAEVPDPMRRSALAVDMFGRSGTDMLPMLAGGAAGLKTMMEEGQKLTGWTTEGATSADSFGDAIGTMQTALKGLWNIIGESIAPSLKELVDNITGMISVFRDWGKEHPDLIKQVSLLALAMGGFLVVAGTLMMMAPAIKAAWSAAMGPVGWIILAVEGLILVSILLWKNWDKVSNFFADMWVKMKIIALEAIDKILAGIQQFVGFIPGLNTKLAELRANIASIIESEKLEQEAKIARKALEAELALLTKATEDEIEKQKKAKLEAIAAEKEARLAAIAKQQKAIEQQYDDAALAMAQSDKINQGYAEDYLARLDKERAAKLEAIDAAKTATGTAYKKAISDVNAYYGEEKLIEKSRIDLARETKDKRISYLDEVINKTKTDHATELELINERYGVSSKNDTSLLALARQTYEERKKALDDELTKTTEIYNTAISKNNELYGILQGTNKSRMAMATEAANAAKAGLDEELKKAREVHSEKMSMLSAENSKALKGIAARSNKNIEDIQRQIDAIDATAQAEADARKKQEQIDKIADITSRLSRAKTAEESARLEEELGKAYAQMEADKVAANRKSQKQILLDIIDGIRAAASEEEAKAAFDLLVAQTVEKSKLDAAIAATGDKKTAISVALTATLADIETERLAANAMEKDKFENAKTNIANRQVELTAAYNATKNNIETERQAAITASNEVNATKLANLATEKTKAAEVFEASMAQTIADRDAVLDAEKKKYDAIMKTIEAQSKLAGPALDYVVPPPVYVAPVIPRPKMPGLASGGIVTQPTMAMVGEAGPEAIIPLSQGLGGVTVNFSQPVFFDREDTMNKFVDMIRKGIQRQDRLRFGGAYNGA